MVQLPWETVWRLLKKLERHVQKNQKQSPKHVCTPLFQQRYSLQQKAEAAARIPRGEMGRPAVHLMMAHGPA